MDILLDLKVLDQARVFFLGRIDPDVVAILILAGGVWIPLEDLLHLGLGRLAGDELL